MSTCGSMLTGCRAGAPMFFRRKDIDPWDWQFVPSLFGLPMKYKLQTGIKYKLKGMLSPGSSLRVIDEHGDFVFAAEAQSNHPWHLNQDFKMTKDNGEFVTLQFCGEAANLHFQIEGIDFGEFA